MAKTELFVRQQAGGVYTVTREDLTTGNIFFVNSATGTNSVGYGNNPDAPFASVDYAVSRVTSNKGDRIYVMPGHVETLSAAGSSLGNGGVFIGATLSNGVSIIGLGVGANRPAFNYTTAIGASMDITAANVLIRNCTFTVNFDALTAMVNVTGADVTFDQCEFRSVASTTCPVLGILTAATAARLAVTNSRFLGFAAQTTTTTAWIKHEVGVDYLIQNNYLSGKCTQAILNATTILRGLIDNNRIVVTTNDAIVMAAASTPLISNNRMNVSGGTAPITAAAGFMAGNVYSAAAGVTAGTASTF